MSAVASLRPADGSGLALMHSALTVPYAAGMRLDPVALIDGELAVTTPRREPVLLVRLRSPLADRAVVVTGSVDGVAVTPAVFSPFSQQHSMLPIHRPTLGAGSDIAGPFTVEVSVHSVVGNERHSARPAAGGALDDDDAAALVEGVVLEGRFARLLLLTTLEKQRCIRVMREIAAARHLELAHGGGLDHRGRSVGVPRRLQPRETDEHYRARLAIYSRWLLPTPAGFAEALNGRGADDEPNAGLPGRVAVTDRFRIVEETNELSVATKLVAVGPQAVQYHDRFQQLLRRVHLVDLDRPAPQGLPAARRARLAAIRRTLSNEVTRVGAADTTRYLSPLAASTFDRSVRLLRALGHTAQIRLLRAHDPAGGARYELGLGVDVAVLTAAQLERAAAGVSALARRTDPETAELARLAGALDPRPVGDDPLGRWLFEPCGFRTVHLLADGSVHLSPLPTFGQWIDGPSSLSIGEQASYEARYHAPGEATGVHVRVAEAAAAAEDVFADLGLPALPERLAPEALRTTLEAIASAPAVLPPPLLDEAAAAGVITIDAVATASTLLRLFNLDQVVAFPYPHASLAGVGNAAAVRDRIVAMADGLVEAGFHSVRGVWDGGADRLLLLASVSQLPGAVAPGSAPPATFRWYAARLPGPVPGADDPIRILQSRGGKASVTTGRTGLALLVSIGYARRGLADPFEVRIELTRPDALLDGDQYGYLMNLLEFLYPIGIEINTFDIRRNHVDLDGDGVAEFLSSRASRTYHRDRHRRPFGSRERRTSPGA